MTYPKFVISKRRDAGPEHTAHSARHAAVLPSSLLFLAVPGTVTTNWVAAGGKSPCLSFQPPSILSPSASRLLQ